MFVYKSDGILFKISLSYYNLNILCITFNIYDVERTWDFSFKCSAIEGVSLKLHFSILPYIIHFLC